MSKIEDKFTNKMYRRMWVPAIISSLGWALSDMADAVVVGQKLGTTGLAAIGLILPIYMINCMFAHSFGLGGSVKYTILLSEGKTSEAVDSFNSVLRTSLLVAVIFAILGNVFMTPLLAILGTVPSDGVLYDATLGYLRILVSATPLFFLSNILNYYLRNDDNNKVAGWGSVIGNITDIVMNIILVLFLGFGTRGAATSTLIGQVVAIVIYLPSIFKKIKPISFNLIISDIKDGIICFKAGVASSITYLFQLAFILLANKMLMKMGGEDGVAVFDMIQNASYLILYLYEGTTRGLQPLLSTYYGERNIHGEKHAMNLGLISGCSVGSIVIITILIFPQLLLGLFGLSGSSAESFGVIALRIYALGAFFGGISILLVCYYQSREQEKEAFILTVLRGAVILIPSTIIFGSFGINGFWWLFPATESISLLVFGIYRKLFGQATNFDEARIFNRIFINESENVSRITSEIEEFCEKWEADFKQTYLVTMAVEEVCLAIKAKGTLTATSEVCVTVISLLDGGFELHLRYDADKFNPFLLQTQRISEDGDYDMDAMGIHVIKQKSKDFFYRHYQGFDSLVIKI
ncbi:MAG: MATE family efflux transporter [Proteocatella sp.]